MSKKHKTVCVIGHFGYGHTLLNGQTIKTKTFTDGLCKLCPDEVTTADTHGGVFSLLKAPFYVMKALKTCRNVLIFPAHNGLRVYAPLLAMLRPLFRGRKLHYSVVGGWLPSFLTNKPFLKQCLQRFDWLYVETATMQRALAAAGFQNVVVMPNCKELHVLTPDELVHDHTEPYKLCTFSRVMKEKGIEDAVNAVKAVNEACGRTVYRLDIYGQIDAEQTQWFADLQNTFPDYVRYGGLVPFDKSVEVLKDYVALLFPTRFYTEGIPGTIIDAYAAGVPVISAKWESFADIVDDGVTGIGYPFGDTEALTAILADEQFEPRIKALKENCLQKACVYLPEAALSVLTERLG